MESKASKTDKTLVPLFGTEEWVEYAIALLPGMTIDEQLYTERQIVKAVAIIEQRKTIMKGGPEAEQLKRELEKINRRDKETLQSLRLMRREDELKAKKLKEQTAIKGRRKKYPTR